MNTQTKANFSYWPSMIISTFVMLALFDAYIVKQALSTATGTVTDNPYEDGLTYEKIIQSKISTARAKVDLELVKENNNLVAKTKGLPLGAKVTLKLKLMRPDDPSLDRNIEESSTDGRFNLQELELKQGIWFVQANLTEDGPGKNSYYIEFKFYN